MRDPRRISALLVAALLAGLAPAGAVSSGEVERLVFRAPISMSTTAVANSCGWHSSCVKKNGHYPDGPGLDWNNDNGTEPASTVVFFTASGHTAAATKKKRAALRVL